jgi:hypothetical protein
MPPTYVPLYLPLPPVPSSTPLPLTLDGEAWGILTPVKSGWEASGASTLLTSQSPVNISHTPSPPVLTPHSPLNQEHLTKEDPPLPRLQLLCRCPWGKPRAPCIVTRKAKYKEEDRYLSTSSLPQQTSWTGNIITPLSQKNLRLWLIWCSLSSRLTNPPGQTVDSFSWLYLILKSRAV